MNHNHLKEFVMLRKKYVSMVVFLIIMAASTTVFASTNSKTKGITVVREKPSITSKKTATMASNWDVKLLEKEMKWFKVMANGEVGYISEEDVTLTDEQKALFNYVLPNYDEIARYETSFSLKDKNRNYNIELSAFKTSVVVPSGGVFSFSQNTGNSSLSSNGWKAAGVISGGKMASGYGGGICQTSSTINNAIIQVPNINIIERRKHSIPVKYVPREQEAMINYGTSDYRFKNTNSYDIYIHNEVDQVNGKLTTTVYKIN